MIDIIEITMDEFKKDIYNKYVELFSEDEQRELYKIEKTYKKGIEKIYKIVLENKTIGFFLLEKLKDYPYYIDYFAIFKGYQDKGYGTEALKRLINKIGEDYEIICEIESVDDENPNTLKRFEFYKRLGFKDFGSKYYLYKVYFTPIVYTKSKKIDKEKYDKIFFDYYRINVEEDALKRKCNIIV
jgi:predicted acetyltransferase